MTTALAEKMSEKSQLLVDNLEVSINTDDGPLNVIDRVSFELTPGKTLALVGESGSGKTLTAFSITRLLPNAARVTGGNIHFDNTDLLTVADEDLRQYRGKRIGMIFQEPMTALNPVFKVGDQIAEVLRIHFDIDNNQAQKRAIEMLKRVGIPDAEVRANAYPHQFSGGMRQRVMIAMALICQPDILIADEPTTALDVMIQAQILDLIMDLQAEMGMAILFITHDLAVVSEFADDVMVMREGRIVERAPSVDLFEKPKHTYTRELISLLPVSGHSRERLPTSATQTAGASSLETTLNEQKPTSVRPVIEARNLSVNFSVPGKGFQQYKRQTVQAVKNVNIALQPGKTFALVGESGSGKTTLVRALSLLIPPTSGEVLFEGTDITHFSHSQLRPLRRSIQMVFQDPYSSLNPRMPVGNLIAEPLVIHGIGNRTERQDRVAELLKAVGLSADMINRYPHQFSGGQRQRIAIARALALDPNLMILDEPVSALDVSVQNQVLNLLQELQEKLGLTYLFIGHNLTVIRYIADEVAVMYLGEIVEHAETQKIFSSPSHPYTQALLEAAPIHGVGKRKHASHLMNESPS